MDGVNRLFILFALKGSEPVVTKGRYQRWLEPDGLLLLESWARDGLTDERITHNMGITAKTLYVWKSAYGETCEALEKSREIVDIQVKNALLKRTLGYKYMEERVEISEKDGRKVVQTTRTVLPDTTAQIFWLKNRRPDQWRDKPVEGVPEASQTEDDTLTEGLKGLARGL